MNGEILFLAHRMPFPPDRGDKIRSHHVLKRLARMAPVHVATFAEDERDMAHEFEVASIASSYRILLRSRPLALAGLSALATGRPVSLAAFHDADLRDYVAQVLATRNITAIYVFSGQMGQYVPADFSGRVIMDFVDVDSAKFEAYGAGGSGPMAWIHAREGRLLRREEERLARRCDLSLFVSEEEASLFFSRLSAEGRVQSDVRAIGNGIDSNAFDPARVAAEPRLATLPGPRLIFTGQMDYAPNVQAVRRAAEAILPGIRAVLPDASFHVIGRNPTVDVQAIVAQPGCHVWGEVADVRPWLAAADIALVPLGIARGVQNKVLEAMAMALPTVLTSGALTGIPARDKEHIRMADSDEELAAAVIDLWRDTDMRRVMGHAARQLVIDRRSWHSALAPLGDALRGSPGPLRNVA